MIVFVEEGTVVIADSKTQLSKSNESVNVTKAQHEGSTK